MKTKPPEESWDIFFEVVTKAGLTAECVHPTFWVIREGQNHRIVYCWWLNSLREFRYGMSAQRTVAGTVADAIELAGAP